MYQVLKTEGVLRMNTAVHRMVQALFWVTLLGIGVVLAARQMDYPWQWADVRPYLWIGDGGYGYPGPLLQGLQVTLQATALGALLTLLVGLMVAGLRLSDSRLGPWVGSGYVNLVRNTPLLVQIFLMYFVFGPMLGLPRFTTAVLALGLYQGAFTAEVLRAGIQAIPRGQREAASALGLAPLQAFVSVIFPQAIRNVLPALVNEAVSLVKNSALLSVVAIADLTTAGRDAVADTFMTFEIWFTVAGLYLLLTFSLSALSAGMAARLNRQTSRQES
jgi:polar amino acid transport system permease protein